MERSTWDQHGGAEGRGLTPGGRGRCTHFGQGQGRTPLVLQNIQADTPVRVNVAMVDFGAKVDLGSAQAYPCPVEREVT